MDEESGDKSFRKGDQADSKSIDSSRSTDEEDEDEVVMFSLPPPPSLSLREGDLFTIPKA